MTTRKQGRRTVLMVDVGGGSVKLMISGRRVRRAFETGDNLSAERMTERVRLETRDWSYDVISIGYPGKVVDGRPMEDPPRVGTGWVRFDYQKALGHPVRIINDAALQALASYRGGRTLFIGLGTGLGSSLIADNVLVPLELGLLRFEPRTSLLDALGARGLERLGRLRWRNKAITWIHDLAGAFCVDEVVLGGGNARQMLPLPKRWRQQTNSRCLLGAERLWGDRNGVIARPCGSVWSIRGIDSAA